MSQKLSFIIFLFLLFLYGCRPVNSEKSKVTVHIHYAYGFKIVLETIPFNGETHKLADTATIKTGDDVIHFYLPSNEERAYTLRVDRTKFQMVFINDAKDITIEINNIVLPNQYKVYGSKATNSVQYFLNARLTQMDEIRKKNDGIDSLKRSEANTKMIDSLKKISDVELKEFFRQHVKFEDTVSSPGAFLYLYNNVD